MLPSEVCISLFESGSAACVPLSTYGVAAVAGFSACMLFIASVLIWAAELAEAWASRAIFRAVQPVVNATAAWMYPPTSLKPIGFDIWYSIDHAEEDIAYLKRSVAAWRTRQASNPSARGQEMLMARSRRLYETRFWRRHRYGLLPYTDLHETRNVKAYMAWFVEHVNPILLHPSQPFIGTDAASIIAQYAYEPPSVFSWRVKCACLLRSLCVWLCERSF